MYKCNRCNAESTADAWNNATEEMYGQDIEPIEDAFRQEEWAYFYTCPECKKECDIETDIVVVQEVEENE